MQAWGEGEERAIRAAVLRHLLVDTQWPVHARGVRLFGVSISGHLDLEATSLRCPLSLEWCYLDPVKPVCLDYATARRISIIRCRLGGLTGVMLAARRVDLSGSTLTGPLVLSNADIAGKLKCRSTQLTGHDSHRNALNADRIKVGADVLLGRVTTAAGAIRLVGADIAGQLDCSDAQLTGHDGDRNALNAGQIKVGGSLFLDKAVTAGGTILLVGADIAGQLSCRGAQLTGPKREGFALSAEGIKVGSHVLLDKNFTPAGTISLALARIGGSVLLGPRPAPGPGRVTLIAFEAQITGQLQWVPTGQVFGRVNLQGAAVGQLADDWDDDRPNGFWPREGPLCLDGFTYTNFGGDHQPDVNDRLNWIRSQYQRSERHWAGFSTQPYEQLAMVYRKAGQDVQAREVAIARRIDSREYGNLKWYRRLGNRFLHWSVRYGYKSWRAGIGLIAVLLVFWALSFLAQQHHLMMPVGDTEGLHFEPSATKCTGSYPCFYPFGYAVDTVIPVINVHQAENWGPDGSIRWGQAWVIGTWIGTGLGWALATLFVASYTGLVRRD
jgi:hypothetical protein